MKPTSPLPSQPPSSGKPGISPVPETPSGGPIPSVAESVTVEETPLAITSRDDATGPVRPRGSATEVVSLVFVDERSDAEGLQEAVHTLSEPEFLAYAEQTLQTKLGLKNASAGYASRALWKAHHQPSAENTLKAIAAFSGVPEGAKFVNELLSPLTDRLPAAGRRVIQKFLAEGPKSSLRLQRLYTVLNGNFDGLEEFKALHALVNEMGKDVLTVMPPGVKTVLQELSRKTGHDALEDGLIILGDVIKHYDTLTDGEMTFSDMRAAADLLKSSTPAVLALLPENARQWVNALGEDNVLKGVSALASLSKNIEVLSDDQWEAKDIAALYELVYTLKQDVSTLKAMLPPQATLFIEKMERALGQEFRQHIDDVYRLLGSPNQALVKSAFDWVSASDPVKRLNAGVGFLEALGKQFGANSEGFEQAMGLLKVDNSLLPAFKNLLDSGLPATARAQALQEIAAAYHTRAEDVYAGLATQLGESAGTAVRPIASAANITEESLAAARLARRQLEIAAQFPEGLSLTAAPRDFLTRTLAETGYDPEEVQRVLAMVANTGDDAEEALTVMASLDRSAVTLLFENVGETSQQALQTFARRSQQLDRALAEVGSTASPAREALRRAFVYDTSPSPRVFDTALQNLKKLGSHADRALSEMAERPDRLKEALTTISDRGLEVLKNLPARRQLTEAALQRLGTEITQESHEKALNMLVRNPELGEQALRSALNVLESFGPQKSQRALALLAQMGDEMTGMIFKSPALGKPFLSGAVELMPLFEKYGMKAVDYLPKMAKGLGKAVPALGAAVSGYDTLRLGTIALTGAYQGKVYADPEVRALALLAASANGLDTVIGIAEAFGVGNVAFPIQLGLAGAEVALDLMIEHFNAHPEKMPEDMRTAIRYAAASAAAAGLLAAPLSGGASLAGSLAIAKIYGAEGTANILNDMTRDLGNQGLKAAAYLGDLNAQAVDKGLANMATGIHNVADMIRNPEIYAQAFQKEAQEVVAYAMDQLETVLQDVSAFADQAQDTTRLAYETLQAVVQNPQKYGQALQAKAVATGVHLVEQAQQHGQRALQELQSLMSEAVSQGVQSAEQAFSTLHQLGAEGVTAAQDFVVAGLKAGGEQAAALRDLTLDIVHHPEKYGALAQDYAESLMLSLDRFINTTADTAQDAIQGGVRETQAALSVLKAAAIQGSDTALQMLQATVQKGQRAGEQVLETLAEMPDRLAEAVLQGYNQALESATASQAMITYVVNHPQEALSRGLSAGEEAVVRTYEVLTQQVNAGLKDIKDTLEAMDTLYQHTHQQLQDYGVRTGRVVARFEDTLTDLMKSGKDIGGDMLDKHWDVLQQRMPEILTAMADLRDAPIDLMLRIARKDRRYAAPVAQILVQRVNTLGTQALNGLKSLGTAGLDALESLAAQPGRMMQKAYETLLSIGESGVARITDLAVRR